MPIEHIERVLNTRLILKSYHTKHNYVELIENGKEKGLKKVFIKDLPVDSLVFTLDLRDKSIKNLFFNSQIKNKSTDKKLNRIKKNCDCVIVYKKNETLCALFCELKSFELETEEYEAQLLNSSLFLDYVYELIKNFAPTPIKINSIKKNYCLIYLKEPNKHDKGFTTPRNQDEYEAKTEEFENNSTQKRYIRKIGFKSKSGQNVTKIISFNDLIR